MRRLLTTILCGAVCALGSADASADDFTYNPPGQLVSGSGSGRVDDTVFVPGMQYPIEVAPSYPNSQVWGRGGSQGSGGGQCDAENYSYPWSDNYCETRQWDVPLCPGGKGHQGQDIRPSTCEKDLHWVVSAEAGEVTQIGSYSVYVISADGTRHRYLHMNPERLEVEVGDQVERGQRLGLVSNAFNGTPTTIHLHYDIFQTVEGVGASYVPTYMSLVRSYEELIGQPAVPCGIVDAVGESIVDDSDRCFSLLGNTQFWRRVDGEGYGEGLWWTYAFSAAAPGAYARWRLDFASSGRYELSAYVEPAHAGSRETLYRVRAGGAEEEVRLDQSSGDGWVSLGEWTFSEGTDQWLQVEDNTGEDSADQLKIAADAIRLVRLDPPEEPDAGGGGGGDAGPSPDAGPVEQDAGGSADAGVPLGGEDIASTGSCACSVPRSPSRAPHELALAALALVGLGRVRQRRTG